jgi:hypothetical protein
MKVYFQIIEVSAFCVFKLFLYLIFCACLISCIGDITSASDANNDVLENDVYGPFR